MKTAVAKNGTSPNKSTDGRRRMLGFIHGNFAKMRPDLRHDTEGLRVARLLFATQVLKLRAPLVSMKRLNETQLGRVIDAMRREMNNPQLPGTNVTPLPVAKVTLETGTSCKAEDMGQVIHLAGNEQVWAIERILDHLNWGDKGREAFFTNNFRVKSPKQLKHSQANAAMTILLRIAISREIKDEKGKDFKVTQGMISANTKSFKLKLGISSGDKK